MATDPKPIRMYIQADDRLAAAMGGAARYLADAAGLENAAVANLQAATIAACKQAFESLDAEHPSLEVSFTRFEDRIEVALSHQGDGSPAVGLDSIAGFAAQVGGAGQSGMAGVDRVQFETQDGAAVTRLTKYLRPASSPA